MLLTQIILVLTAHLTTAQLGKMKVAYIYSDGSAISSIGTPDATLASVKFTLKNVNAGDVIPVQFVFN